MIAIGLDYGTTNSLMTVYQFDMTSRKVQRVMVESSVTDGKQYIRSPKRLLSAINTIDDHKMAVYIAYCVRTLCEKLRINGVDFSDVVFTITVPNAFKDPQCQFLKRAVVAALGEFMPQPINDDSIHILPEPVAAALYYAYSLRNAGINQGTRYVIVSDMGGGTTDLAAVRVEMQPDFMKFKVLCTEQDVHLGGDDIDAGIMDFIKRRYDVSFVNDDGLLLFCRHIKECLSLENVVSDYLLAKDSGREVEVKMTRSNLDEIIRSYNYLPGKVYYDIYEKLLGKLRMALSKEVNKTGWNYNEFVANNCVLLPVGGTSRIPLLRQVMQKAFPNAKLFNLKTEDGQSDAQISKYDSVSRGAAIYSAYHAGIICNFSGKIIVQNRTLHRTSIRYAGEKLITCVSRSMPDGDSYVSVFKPKYLSPDGKSFSLKKLEFYQGGHNDFIDEDSQLLKSIVITDRIYTNGRLIDDIDVVMRFVIAEGRLSKIKVFVKNGGKDNADFNREYEL